MERSGKNLEGLNMFDGTNLIFISDVDQDISMEYLLVHKKSREKSGDKTKIRSQQF